MENSMPSHQREEAQNPIEDYRKRLLKKEQRMLEELEEAKEKQAKALERFHRAEARLQKRTARLQRMEGRLSLMHQHLSELPGFTPRSILMPPANQSTRIQSTHIEEVVPTAPPPTPATPVAETEQMSTPPPTATPFVYTPLEKQLETEESAHEGTVPTSSAATAEGAASTPATNEVEVMPPMEVTTSTPESPLPAATSAVEEVQSVEETISAPTSQAPAATEAEAMPELGAPLSTAQSTMETSFFHEPSESPPRPDMDEADLEDMLLPTPVAAQKASTSTARKNLAKEDHIPPPLAASPSPVMPAKPAAHDDIILSASTTEVLERARVARDVAEAAEENARKAAERAALAAERLEQIGSGRHLLQEVIELEAEAERTDEIALETENAAREAERLAAEELRQELERALPQSEEAVVEEEPSMAEPSAVELPGDESSAASVAESSDSELPAVELSRAEVSIAEQSISEQPADEPFISEPSIAEPSSVGPEDKITPTEAEEEDEHLVSVSVADIVAANAAEAEALAEASSVRTREARRLAMQAERALGEVRLAMRNGTATGEEATARLQFAERQATWAFALLADAEAAEEQARQAAMHAEAQAEVAEGLHQDDLDQEDARLAQHLVGTASSDDIQSEKSDQNEEMLPIEFDEEGDTLTELPIVGPQETP